MANMFCKMCPFLKGPFRRSVKLQIVVSRQNPFQIQVLQLLHHDALLNFLMVTVFYSQF